MTQNKKNIRNGRKVSKLEIPFVGQTTVQKNVAEIL